MDLDNAIARAKRGFREDAKLYLVAVSSLTVAFVCLGTALLAIANLGEMADRWGRSGRMTIYLRDGARQADVQQLQMVLEDLPEVREVEHLTAAAAREQFVRQAELGTDLAALPPDVFPASLEITLAGGTPRARVAAIAERVGRFSAVDDVETYRGWFERLDALLIAGRTGAIVLALLVIVCVLAVVGNTIRLAVAGRRAEIEVMKLCGATDSFVRGPFVFEGAAQGLIASVLAVLLIGIAYLALHGTVDESIAALAGVEVVFLHPLIATAIVFGGGLAGAAGSAWSLRRYLVV